MTPNTITAPKRTTIGVTIAATISFLSKTYKTPRLYVLKKMGVLCYEYITKGKHLKNRY